LRWDARAQAALRAFGRAATRLLCQLALRSGCSEATDTFTRAGGSAADVPSSEATGAAVEPV
jgi:hypothetical protein